MARAQALWIAAVAVAAIVLASLYGVSDELHQRLVHGRDPDVHDWIADALGSVTGALAATMLRWRAHESSRSTADNLGVEDPESEFRRWLEEQRQTASI